MVRVFMCNKNAVDIAHVQADALEGFDGSLTADSHIHKKVGIVRSHIDTIAAASAGNAFKSHFLFSFPDYFGFFLMSFPHDFSR